MNKISYPPGFRARRGLNWGAIGFMYASYYMCRYNFRFAGPGMNEEFGFDKTDLANIWVIWSLAYGTGQLVNGLFTDRIGGKWSMLIGAIGTIACNLIFGFSSFIGTLSTFALIALLNGWFQSFGAPGMGLLMIPLGIGVVMLFLDGYRRFSQVLIWGSASALLVGVLNSLQMRMTTITLWQLVVEIVMIAAGAGLMFRSLKGYEDKDQAQNKRM